MDGRQVVYKTPDQERIEMAVAYAIAAPVGFGLHGKIPSLACGVAFVAVFMLVSVLNTWRLKHFGTLMPVGEMLARRAEDAAGRSLPAVAAEKTVVFVVAVTTIILLILGGSAAENAGFLASKPWLVAILVAGSLFAGWRQAQREQGAACKVVPVTTQRLARLRPYYLAYAAVAAAAGLASGLYLQRVPFAFAVLDLSSGTWSMLSVACGLAGAVAVVAALEAGRRMGPPASGLWSALGRSMVTGILFFGVPMAVVAGIAGGVAALVLGGMRGVSAALPFAACLLPPTLGVVPLTGVPFGFLVGLSAWAAMRASRRAG